MPRTDPDWKPVVSRRRMLIGAATSAVVAVVAPACSSPPAPPAVDELEAHLDRARQDSQLATAAAAGAPPPVARALEQVAAERTAHARALSTEIARLAPSTTTSTPASSTPTSAAVTPPPPLAAVIDALKASADSSASSAATCSGYRAGLLGSIAAACTAAYSVALAFGTSAP